MSLETSHLAFNKQPVCAYVHVLQGTQEMLLFEEDDKLYKERFCGNTCRVS